MPVYAVAQTVVYLSRRAIRRGGGGGGASSPAPDTTPDAFTFVDVTGATASTQYTSNTITVAGVDAATNISIIGGTYSINGGAYTSSAGSVSNGDTVTVRATSSGSTATAVNAVVTIGGVSDTYTVTTSAPVAPAFTANPTVSGTATSGQTLTGTTGTITGSPTPTVTRQWYRADPVTSGGNTVTFNGGPLSVTEELISGATGATYVLTDDDIDFIVWERVTATNASGSATADSAATGPVASSTLLSLDFTTGSLPSGVTASGGANGTRINASGVLVAATAPRFDYNPVTHAAKGLLVEEARTNLVISSTDFSTSDWTKPDVAIVTASGVLAPDGTTVANKFVPSSSYSLLQYVNETITHAGPVTAAYSAFVYAAGYSKIALRESASSGSYASFDLATAALLDSGTVAGFTVSNPTITDFGGGWYHITVTIVTPSAINYNLGLWTLSPAYTNSEPSAAGPWQGDGTSGICAFNAQLEVGAYPTSAILTTSGSVTRSADVVSFPIPSGVTNIRTTYEDNTTADEAVTALATYTIPAGQKAIKTIVSF